MKLNKNIAAAGKNIKTTIIGLFSIILSVLVFIGKIEPENIQEILSMILAIAGLLGIAGKDGDQTGLPKQ